MAIPTIMLYMRKAKKDKKQTVAVIQVTQIRLIQAAQAQTATVILQNHTAILPDTPETDTMMAMMMSTATANLIGTDTMKMMITQGVLTMLWMNMKNTERIGKYYWYDSTKMPGNSRKIGIIGLFYFLYSMLTAV